jgi:hypothetical protein
MKKIALAAAGLALALGCQTTQAFLDQNQGSALATAQSRARFELNCPDVQTSVLSSKIIDPAPFQGGMWRGEYTVGVRGCNKQMVYMVICLDSNDCNAWADSANMSPSPFMP